MGGDHTEHFGQDLECCLLWRRRVCMCVCEVVSGGSLHDKWGPSQLLEVLCESCTENEVIAALQRKGAEIALLNELSLGYCLKWVLHLHSPQSGSNWNRVSRALWCFTEGVSLFQFQWVEESISSSCLVTLDSEDTPGAYFSSQTHLALYTTGVPMSSIMKPYSGHQERFQECATSLQEKRFNLGMVDHICNPSYGEV
jgi:hypothetical protein